MKRIKILSGSIAFSAVALAAHMSAGVDIHPVITSQTIIESQILGNCVGLASPALNDSAEVAFTAFCDGRDRLFTSRRIVVTAGDPIDGKVIQSLYPGVVAINNRGQVLYQAYFTEPGESPTETAHEGLFLDHRLLSAITYDNRDQPFTYRLSEDGLVTAEFAQPSMEKNAIGHRLQKHRVAEPTNANETLPFPRNRLGQFLINVQGSSPQILLLLASPIKR